LETRLNLSLGRPSLDDFQLQSSKPTFSRRNGSHSGGKRMKIRSAEIMLEAPMMAPAPMPEEMKDSSESSAQKRDDGKPVPEFELRSDFRALAAFVPDVTTDEAGKAEVRFKLPDSLTRYRVMAVASS